MSTTTKTVREEINDAIFEVELLIETHRVTDGPRNDRERAKQAEQHQMVRQLIKIRKALYLALDIKGVDTADELDLLKEEHNAWWLSRERSTIDPDYLRSEVTWIAARRYVVPQMDTGN